MSSFAKVAFAEALLKSGRLGGAESEYRAALSIYDAQYTKGQPTDEYQSFTKSLVEIEAAHGEDHVLAASRMKLAPVLLLGRGMTRRYSKQEQHWKQIVMSSLPFICKSSLLGLIR